MNCELSKVGCYEFLAEAFHCDFSHHLFMGHLGNHMLNAADFHSRDRGFGMVYLNPIHKTWVLSRLAIEMDEMPGENDRFNVETWVENAMRYFTNRNFRVTSPDGSRVYGYGRSIWAMIDTETRQPQDILSVRDGEIVNWLEKEKECPIEKGSRVKMSDDAQLVRTIDMNYSDIDVNGHVNSVKYIEHVLDLFPLEKYKASRLKRIDIAYVAEAHYGDKLKLYKEQTGDEEYCVRITKVSPEEENEIETCRSKIKFVNN